MKFNFFLIPLIFISMASYAQSPNTISAVYGFSTTNVDIHDAIGDYGYDQKTGNLFGVMYSRAINKFFSIETGLLVSNDKVQLNVIEAGLGNIYSNGNVKTISVPIYAKFTFLKYLFADAGCLIDKQTNYVNDDVIQSQSGLGVEVGVGAQYTYDHLTIFVNPYLRQYAITRTENNLSESGFKFGLGYSF